MYSMHSLIRYHKGFDTELGLPLWTSYTVSNETIQKDTTTKTDKWAEDPRFEDSHLGSCARLTQIQRKQEIVYTHLFPQGILQQPSQHAF